MLVTGKYRIRWLVTRSLLAAAVIALGYCGQSAWAQDATPPADSQGAQTDNNAGACDQTTQAAAKACDFNAQNDFWIAVGTCDNLADAGKKAACNKQARSDRQSAKSDCQAQTAARQQVCQGLGQGPTIRRSTRRISSRTSAIRSCR